MAITDRPTETQSEPETPRPRRPRRESAGGRSAAQKRKSPEEGAPAPEEVLTQPLAGPDAEVARESGIPDPAASEPVAEAQAGEQPPESASAEKPVDAKPVDAKPVDAKRVDGKPTDAKPVVAKQPAAKPRTDKPAPDPRLVQAFRELHERRLHAFALLLTLGDRNQAAKLTEAALTVAGPRLGELTHPERGATWLRHQVFREAPRRPNDVAIGLFAQRGLPGPMPVPEVGVTGPLLAALAELPTRERAALILSDVERFRELDIAEILGCHRNAVEEVVQRGRAGYGRAYLAACRADGSLEKAELPEVIREAAGPALRRPAQHAS